MAEQRVRGNYYLFFIFRMLFKDNETDHCTPLFVNTPTLETFPVDSILLMKFGRRRVLEISNMFWAIRLHGRRVFDIIWHFLAAYLQNRHVSGHLFDIFSTPYFNRRHYSDILLRLVRHLIWSADKFLTCCWHFLTSYLDHRYCSDIWH